MLPSLTVAQEYFQQEVAYRIDVSLDVPKHRLHANLELDYVNNSPDTLHFIWMHLWPNAYKDRSSALVDQQIRNGDLNLYYARQEDRGWIDSLGFKVNGNKVKWTLHPDHIDIAKVELPKPLAPGEQLNMSTPFRVQVPSGEYSRLGHIGRSYQITQWYPKPAVYDREGWHPMPYLDLGEFYSEFGSFEVNITVPKNFVVGATGDLQNKKEIAWLDSIAAATASGPLSSKDSLRPNAETKTIQFRQEKVHDFAWFADMRYHVLKGQVELPSGKEVTTWAMFTPDQADLWMNSIDYINKSVLNYSKWVGEYPYNHVTAVDGTISAGGGMEYPNITVIGQASSGFELDVVITHEVGHNWFYGILGSNERTHAWMDEGLNSYYEGRHMSLRYPSSGVFGQQHGFMDRLAGIQDYGYWGHYELGYLFNARRGQDQKLDQHSANFTETNYGTMVYGKTALVMKQLAAYLGQERFDACMQRYFEDWKFKHPGPDDLRLSFEQESGEDLSWAFVDMVQTTKKVDVVLAWEKEGKSKSVQVAQNGLEAPYTLQQQDSSKWYAKGAQPNISASEEEGTILSDPNKNTLDIDRRNDRLRSDGKGQGRPFQLKFLGRMEDPTKKQLFWSPIAGWNEYDKGMLGAAFYSNGFPTRKLEYVVAPMYSFGGKSISGSMRVSYNLFHINSPETPRTRSRTGVGALRYMVQNSNGMDTWAEKVAPFFETEFNAKLGSGKSSKLRVRPVAIWERSDWKNETGSGNSLAEDYYLELQGAFINKNALTPWTAKAVVLGHQDFVRISGTAAFQHRYNRKKKAIGLRAFIGTFLYEDLSDSRHAWRMGGIDGQADFLYDHVFLGRNESSGMLSQQFVPGQGAFKAPTDFGRSDSWLFALNADLDLPIPYLPIALFADVGIAPITKVTTTGKEKSSEVYYDFGIGFPIVRDIFEIWMPIAYSKDIKNELEETKDLNFGERIRFTLRLELLDPFEFVRKLKP